MANFTKITREACKRPGRLKHLFDAIPDDIEENINIDGDNLKITLGEDGATDSYMTFDGTDLIFYDSTVGVTKTLTQLAASTGTLDQAFDAGKVIDGAEALVADAFQVGGSVTKLQIWDDGTDLNMKISAGDCKFSAVGGNFDFADDNITTLGTVQGGTISDGTATLTGGTISDGTASLSGGGFTALATIAGLTDLSAAGALNFKVSGDNDDYIVFQTAGHVPGITTSGLCNLTINADGGTIDFGDELLTTTGTLTVHGITNTTNVIDTTAAIQIGADNVNLTLGASDATDSKIFFDGAGNLTFYDSNLGVNATLSDLASTSWTNPTIVGDLTISNGQIAWTDSSDEIAGTFTFSNVANDGIDIVANSATTSNIIHVASTSLTSGTGIRVDTAEATLNLGYYFEAYDTTAPATVFSVGENGVVTIAGDAGGDALIATAGHVQVTDGDVDIDEGKITVDSTSDEQSYIKRDNATGTNAVLKVWEANAAGGVVLDIDQDHTGDMDAVSITNAGTGFAVSTTGGVAGSRGYEFIAAAAATGPGLLCDGTTGTWVGAAATGLIQANSDGALADVAASMCYLAYAGDAGGANQTGSCLNIVETGAASGTSYAASINSTNNNGLQIDLGIVTTTALDLGGASGHTATLINVDGTAGANGWIGANGVGMVHLASDGALAHAGSSLLYSTYTGNTAAIVPNGSCAYFYENGTIAAGGYAVGIAATGGGALNVTQAGTGYGCINVQCAANATSSMVTIDGVTNDFLGEDEGACLKITGGGALAHTDASMLNITNSGSGQAAHMGTSVRIIDTCNAGAGSYAMYISATDADTEALKVDDGDVVVDETVTASLGFINLVNTKDVSGPPTKTELNAADGLNWDATGTTGQFAFVDDNNAHTDVYLVMYDAAGDYWYVALTKAV